MRLLDLFRRARPESSAAAAKQRLQVLLTLERASMQGPDFLPLLQRELLDVIRKYVEIDDTKVKVEFERDHAVSMLEVQIELPASLAQRAI
jgi:cell division topological specificity factor